MGVLQPNTLFDGNNTGVCIIKECSLPLKCTLHNMGQESIGVQICMWDGQETLGKKKNHIVFLQFVDVMSHCHLGKLFNGRFH